MTHPDGTEDGILEFANMKGGTQTITARLRSDPIPVIKWYRTISTQYKLSDSRRYKWSSYDNRR